MICLLSSCLPSTEQVETYCCFVAACVSSAFWEHLPSVQAVWNWLRLYSLETCIAVLHRRRCRLACWRSMRLPAKSRGVTLRHGLHLLHLLHLRALTILSVGSQSLKLLREKFVSLLLLLVSKCTSLLLLLLLRLVQCSLGSCGPSTKMLWLCLSRIHCLHAALSGRRLRSHYLVDRLCKTKPTVMLGISPKNEGASRIATALRACRTSETFANIFRHIIRQ